MAQRSDVALVLKNEAIKVIPEIQSEYYKKKAYKPFYTQFCAIKKITDMEWTAAKGKRAGGSAYNISTSFIGVPEFQEVGEEQPLSFQDPTLGYPIYLKKKKFALGVELTVEVNRDFKALQKELKTWITDINFPESLMLTKERLAAGLINTGGFTAGSPYFDNSIAGVISPSYGALVYDAIPLFNLSTNTRLNKVNTAYYNHIGSLALTFDNLVTADTLVMSTNAYTENNTPFNNNLDPFIMFNPAQRLAGFRIINSTLIPENNNNDVNPLAGSYKVVSNPYITNTSAWCIGNKYGIYFYDNDDIQIKTWEVPETDLLRMKAVIELAVAVYDWRPFVAAGFTQS